MPSKILRSLDLYSKIPKDLTEATPQGATFSICALFFMVFLFIVELYSYSNPSLETQIVIDDPSPMIRISFNISMLDLPCDFVAVDVFDILGTNRMNVSKNIDKWKLSYEGLKGAYQGRNRPQRNIAMFDENHVNLDLLHENGIHAVPLKANTFITWLEEHEYTFVDFYAPWCSWCQRVAPTWEAFAEETERQGLSVSVVQVDCDENKELCNESKIMAFPTMRFYRRMEAIMDYNSDRTVEGFIEFSKELGAISKANAGKDAGSIKLIGVHDENWPGCMITGSLMVNRVPGNFHIEAKSGSHDFNAALTNLSHYITNFNVGFEFSNAVEKQIYKLPIEHRQFNPLNDRLFTVPTYHQAPHHYINIVGTEYMLNKNQREPFHGYQIISYDQIMQYNLNAVPEAKFSFDFSPMAVRVLKKEQKTYKFVTHLLALIGGTFSMIGLVDAFFWKAKKIRRTKSEIAR
mmetsp:Transcript_4022/g.6133  ORF Transcript_4022/g.6133 Transcript_4022/m.6133 type:complete len:462 (+) Transcript_4022:47-1432(+)|eukprot:CAMPEP_0171454074 /NCGR_PEP_ID=MMETSP0945-20130129/1514_1 /TAXON_ID=109269 /ORGANISM="Vaucheria litorea, Strain CCMP2940" /LENGTH=461 /DNA_ID=CAMNT_0011979041 /DNA_START=24 /DNA_END=1409 /DNA_ORIENTATION=-